MLQRSMLRTSLLLAYLLCLSFLLIPQAEAAEIQMGEKYILDTSDIIPDNLIVAAGSVRINGQVEGDVIVTGGEIQISGLIAGDLIAAGGSIIIDDTASVGRNIRVAGGRVTLNNKTLGNINAFAGDLQINGPVDGNIVVGAGTFSLNSTVAGSTKIEAEEINLDNKTVIQGDFKYSSRNKPFIAPSAKIQGKTIILPLDESRMRSPYTSADFWIQQLLGVISYWIIGLIVLALIPRSLQKHVDNFGKRFWPSLGLGFVGFIASIVGFVILAITIIGLPLAMILGAAFLILVYVSKLLFAFYLVQKLGKVEFTKEHNKWYAAGLLFLSILIIDLVALLPVLGSFFMFIVVLAGLGAHLMTKWQMYNEFYQKKLI